MLRVRFAPSPTGNLHIGGARTALFNWMHARKNNGEFILRIEDTDKNRSQPEYLNEILESLRWLKLDWDKIYYQSERFDIYQKQAKKLIEKGLAYQKEGAVFFKYDFKEIKVNDLIRGQIIFSELPKPEEVIIKKDGSPAYNFACCVDDGSMGITCVIRGEDHISNTPKQVLMYRALEFNLPEFAHIPLTLASEGGRLSKRHGATAISEYRNQGYLSEALTNYFLLLGWSPGDDQEIIPLSRAKEIFCLQDINKTGSAFSAEKLKWVNSQYIKNKSQDCLVAEIIDFLKAKKHSLAEADSSLIKKAAGLLKTRLNTLEEFAEQADFLFKQKINYCQSALPLLERNLTAEVAKLQEELNQIEFNLTEIEATFRQTVNKLGLKVKDIIHPVRVALTGRQKGPGLFELMEALGKEKVSARLTGLIQYWQNKQQAGGKNE